MKCVSIFTARHSYLKRFSQTELSFFSTPYYVCQVGEVQSDEWEMGGFFTPLPKKKERCIFVKSCCFNIHRSQIFDLGGGEGALAPLITGLKPYWVSSRYIFCKSPSCEFKKKIRFHSRYVGWIHCFPKFLFNHFSLNLMNPNRST